MLHTNTLTTAVFSDAQSPLKQDNHKKAERRKRMRQRFDDIVRLINQIIEALDQPKSDRSSRSSNDSFDAGDGVGDGIGGGGGGGDL